MKKIALAIALFFLLVTIGYCEERALQVTIKSDKSTYMLGDDIIVETKLKNLSSKALEVNFHEFKFYYYGWKLNNHDAQWFGFSDAPYKTRLMKPGEEIIFPLQYKLIVHVDDSTPSGKVTNSVIEDMLQSDPSVLPFALCRPGKYELTFSNKLKLKIGEKYEDYSLTSNSLTIEVLVKGQQNKQ